MREVKARTGTACRAPTKALLRLGLCRREIRGGLMQRRCSRCDAEMICDPAGDCWCKKLPHGRMRVDAQAAGCFCRDCLVTDLKEQGLEVFVDEAKDR